MTKTFGYQQSNCVRVVQNVQQSTSMFDDYNLNKRPAISRSVAVSRRTTTCERSLMACNRSRASGSEPSTMPSTVDRDTGDGCSHMSPAHFQLSPLTPMNLHNYYLIVLNYFNSRRPSEGYCIASKCSDMQSRKVALFIYPHVPI
jgi:hypothetical protein